MPLTVRYRAHAPKVPPNSRPELQHPSPDRLVADLQPALRQQIFNIAVAQGEAQVEPNRVPDHIRWEAVAGGGNRLPAQEERRPTPSGELTGQCRPGGPRLRRGSE